MIAKGQSGGDGIAGLPGTKGKTGAGGKSAVVHIKGSGVAIRAECVHQPTPGAQGFQGEYGGRGGDGGMGGSTGKVFIEVEEPSDFRVVIDRKPGIGGVEGKGGDGGEGGDGGDAAKCVIGNFTRIPIPVEKMDCWQTCDRSRTGPGTPGPKGFQGANGLKGQEGLLSPVCTKIGGKETGECV